LYKYDFILNCDWNTVICHPENNAGENTGFYLIYLPIRPYIGLCV